MDSRKKFLATISAIHLGLEILPDIWEKNVEGVEDAEHFLNDEKYLVLYSCLVDGDKKRIKFQIEVGNVEDAERFVVFYKNGPTIVREDNYLSNVNVTSIQGSVVSSLFFNLNNVFCPLLAQQQDDKKDSNNAQIERQLSVLHAGLRSSIMTANSVELPVKEGQHNSLEAILNIDNEMEFWINVTNTTKSNEKRRMAAAFRDILMPLAKDFSVIDAIPLAEVEDILEKAHNTLDDLWRHEPPYSKNRTTHLMDLVASNVRGCLEKQLASVKVWEEEYIQVSNLLQQCISVGEKWLKTCKELTEVFWPNYSLHIWSGQPFVPENLLYLVERLKEVLNVRTIHKQLIRLLTTNELEDLNTLDMFKPFEELDILKCGSHMNQPWNVAKKKFEYLLQPAEHRVGVKLRKQLSNVNANTRQLLHEFGRYSELIERPVLKQSLLNERQYLMNILHTYLKKLSTSMVEAPILSIKYDTPQVVSEILATRQLEAKALEVQSISEKLLNDLQGYNDLKAAVSDLIRDLKSQHTELFDAWTREITSQINDHTLSLRESDPVVQFTTSSKLMKVNYSSRLVTLISEVRQLTALGYRIPSLIEQTSSHAKQFMKYAKTLEQIANFHNTIGDRMLPSQRPMMLASAVELSKLVQEQEVVSWGDTKSVESYVENLKSAVEKLYKENNLLRSQHDQILEKINDLEEVDLIKYYQKWRDTSKELREILYHVQQKGFKNMHTWRIEVDNILCKILEKQYIKSLDTLHLYLPEIYADLIYRDKHLQFSPDEKALKEKYDQQLKRFLEIPKSFRGVSENTEMFAEIIERCTDQLSKVTKNTENLFEQLKAVSKHWESWLTLDTLDVSKLKTWQHWDVHFRGSKAFGQEIAKLPSTEERVGCFIIGLSRLRSDLESHNRSYWDQLASSLKDSIAVEVVKLQEFIDRSTATLNKPLTFDEMEEADASHANILQQSPEMEILYKEMVQKSNTLTSWCREKLDSVNRIQAAWERLQSLLDNHQHIISKQLDTVKTTLNIESENLNSNMERFAARWDQIKPRPNSGQIATESLQDLKKHLENIKEKRQQWAELCETKDKILSSYRKFNIEPALFPLCEEIEKDLDTQEDTWKTFEEFYDGLDKLNGEEWIVFRKKVYLLEEFVHDWQVKLQKMEVSPLVTRMMQEVLRYKEAVPSLKYLKGDDFTEKHWLEAFGVLGIIPKSLDTLYLKDFLMVSNALVDNSSELQGICKRAASEVVVRQALAELDQWDMQSHFLLMEHTDSRGHKIMLIKDFKDILNKIGDNQSLLQSVKNSADYDSFSERAGIWESRLSDLDQYITSLTQIQRRWVYLEPIFGSGTLIQEKSRFDRLDRDYRNILNFIERETRVCGLCRFPNLRSLLENLQDQLSRCQNSLDNFLAEKRNKFPRFYFLGDDDLLEVVGQSSKEQVIQTHLKKLFAGINGIQMDGTGTKIKTVCSLEGECVDLVNPVDINKPVEEWLNVLVQEMHITLKGLLIKSVQDGQNADPLKYPSQILCLSDQITFTTKTESAISNMTLPPLLAAYKAQLAHYNSLELNDGEKSLSSLSTGRDEEAYVLELKLKALLLNTIHHIDVLEELIDSNVAKVGDWNWQKQLRYYSNSSGEVLVKMVNAQIEYSYEYQGNSAQLVRTPLTDKCFLTLMQGMHLGMGGNPYGPAGTGKTESVKALGGLLGRQVLVFNCDEGIDSAAMGRILSGLVQSGAWGCFDEFNRLDEATLSTISMHIQLIQNALSSQNNTLTLLDKEIPVNKHSGIFVTLNPAGAEYGGRNKLPDNLKQLFRPIVMTQPDHEQIARTLLHLDGFRNGDLIGRKLVEVFYSAGKLLSSQQHYDWGLRALRTVLGGCSNSMKQFLKKNGVANLQDELNLVVGVLRMNTLSKLTYLDSEKFDGLLRDVFPGVELQSFGQDSLIKAFEESCVDLGLVVNNRQITKCIELFEQLKQRMGVALVGPPNSGKTTIRNILFHAMPKLGKILKQHVLNPKSMPRTQLLGQIDGDTRQWSDGVLTLYSALVTAEPKDVHSWIVCDGDIDPEWVESLNSVLDDNRLLSLPSGCNIQFGPNINFIFETHDLSLASPATISRMGIIFLSEEDLNISDFLTTCLNQHQDNQSLKHFVHDYLFKAIDWAIDEGELVTPRSKISIVKNVWSLARSATTKPEFIVSLLNSIGGQLVQDFREVFFQFIFQITHEVPPTNLQNFFYNREREIVDSYTTNLHDSSWEVRNGMSLYLTGQVKQILDTLRVWLKPKKEQHFLIIGAHGSAKLLLLNFLCKERTDSELAVVHCCAHVTPQQVVTKISQFCMIVNSAKGRVYKPKKGHLVLYFKNLHLLKKDQWGTNMLIEFLHQMITYKGFFDHNLEWVGIENISIVGSLETTSGTSVRFTSIMNILKIELPQEEDLQIMYLQYLSAIVREKLPNSNVWSKPKLSKLTNLMMVVYRELKNNFNSSEHQHYKFNPHNLTDWCSGIINYSIDTSDVESCILEIVCHEGLRILGDKLVDDSDKNKLYNILNTSVQSEFGKVHILKDVSSHYYVAPGHFGSKNDSFQKLNAEDWSNYLQKGIIQYERDGQQLDVLLIPEILSLTAAISRVLKMPGGNLVLVGNAGVGRRSALKIVSALHSCKLIAPGCVKQPSFNNDLKAALQWSGIDGESVILLLQDYILTNDSILNIINTLLSSGEVLGLYNSSELDNLVSGLKDEASRENFEGSCSQFFAERVKRNLHIVVCLEESNKSFTRIMENCPALRQICTTIWLSNWSKDSLDSMPKLLIAKNNSRNKADAIEACQWFSDVQNYVGDNVFTPIRYVNLVKTYMEIYLEKKRGIQQKQNKLMAGVSKLNDAKGVVAELKKKAGEQQVKLEEKQAKANSALDMISNTMKNANTHKEEMEVLKQNTEKENEQLMKRKQEIELELAEVEPLIQEARSAVGNIKNESLSEIRSLRAPPEIIRDILEGVLRLMGIQDTSWNSMKVFLAKRGVKEDIRSFDASRINPESRQVVERLINTKKDSFDPKSSKRASVAAAPLAAWVIANVRYSYVLDKIKPLEREQNKLKKNLDSAEMQLGELSAGLLDVDATVAKLKGQLSTYTKEAAEIEIHLNQAQETLRVAEDLVEKLNDEYERWQVQLKELTDDLSRLSMCCLLSSAFITFLSGEPEDTRIKTFNELVRNIADNDWFNTFSLEEFLSTERDRLQWQSEGLSSDKLSIQNAIIIFKSIVTNLIVDPTSSATSWIKEHFSKNNVEVVSQTNSKFNTTLELAVRFGKILIIEEVEDIQSSIYPILKKEFIYQGERKLVQLNGKTIDYHNDFLLILSSRNQNIQLPADIVPYLNIVNFTITLGGLCEQLLNSAIKQESPQLEERRKQLSKDREDMQEKLYNFQNQLLEDLANSSGDILQNKSLITSLNETKASSNAISKALIESQQIQEKLQQEYDVYREISAQGSLLYFAANEYSKINNLYSLSVASYTRLFLRSLPSSEESKHKFGDTRRMLIQSLYQFMGRGIFKADRIKFVIHLVHKMFPEEIPDEEWKLFLGQVLVGTKGDLRESVPSWLPELTLQSVYTLQIALPDVFSNLKLGEQVSWKHFMEAKACETEFPTHCKLTEFQKVLVVQALRPDRVYSALYASVLHLTGLKTLNLEVLQLSRVLKETIPKEPVFLITSGNDPSDEIKELAKAKIGLERYTEIPMGEGQEEKAFQALEEATKLGKWLTLKNIHLVTSWLPILSQSLQNSSIHEDFRLWLVSEPHPLISSVLAQNCLKVAYESPQGIKNNLMRSFNNWGQEHFQKLSSNSARIFFALATIHATLQERRTYIPQGWTKFYEFSDVDLTSAAKLVEELTKSSSTQIPWKFIVHLCYDAIYGGRIENVEDLSVLNAYLHQYLNDEILSHRWKPLGLVNTIPTSSKFQEYINVIQQLSNRDLPSYFKLPENIHRSLEKNLSANIVQSLKSLEVMQSITSQMSENLQKSLSPFMNLWKRLNQGQDFIRMTLPNAIKTGSPILVFISEEYRNAVALIQNIHKCFAGLNKLCKGNIITNKSNLKIARSLIALQTPSCWLKQWLGPKDPSLYLRSVVNKTIHISQWAKEKNMDTFLRNPLNLSYLFRPETFLQALKQDFSRKNNIPMDELVLANQWSESSGFSVVLSGLFIEGALFDGTNLTACSANSENINPIPNCYLNWTTKKNNLVEKNFEVPLYFTSLRDKQLTSLQVPNISSKEKNVWIQAGVAFLLSY